MRAALTAIALLAAGACDPVWSLNTRVISQARAPLPGAAVAIICPADSADRVSTHADLSDSNGDAQLHGSGFDLPAGCRVTVAKPGYRTVTLTLEALCAPAALDDCYRIQRAEVVLAPLP